MGTRQDARVFAPARGHHRVTRPKHRPRGTKAQRRVAACHLHRLGRCVGRAGAGGRPEQAVRNRFAHRLRDRCREGLERIADARGTPDPVALLIADQRMPGLTGVEFLERAHALHPHAKRILLMERDYTTANPIISAMTHGQIDYHLAKPWAPELGLYPAVTEFLASWASANSEGFSLFRVVAPENSRRAHEIRDLFTRFPMPYTFHTADSDEGTALLEEIGQTGCEVPVAVRHDGRVLVGPTDVDLVEAIGGETSPGAEVFDVDDHRRGACRALGLGLRGVGGPRDARRRAARLRRSGRRQLAHPQRPRIHVGHQRS